VFHQVQPARAPQPAGGAAGLPSAAPPLQRLLEAAPLLGPRQFPGLCPRSPPGQGRHPHGRRSMDHPHQALPQGPPQQLASWTAAGGGGSTADGHSSGGSGQGLGLRAAVAAGPAAGCAGSWDVGGQQQQQQEEVVRVPVWGGARGAEAASLPQHASAAGGPGDWRGALQVLLVAASGLETA